MLRIPPALDTDPEDVAWALQTAEALWKRNERTDAIVWLRRAAQAASDAEDDERALTLARGAAELAEGVPKTSSPAAQPPPAVPTAAQVHAGMLDPWADEAPTMDRERVSAASPAVAHPPPSSTGVVTSAALPAAPRPAPRRVVPPPLPSAVDVDLSAVEALGDLPDDAREAFARAAIVRTLTLDDEVSGFALALVLEGSADLAATIVDAPALRLEAGAVLRARGTIEHVVPVRLVGAAERSRVATWDDRAVEEAFRTCPWVEDELRSAGDRLQALVGVTMGPLGERLDAAMRAEVTGKLRVRTLSEHEAVATRGDPVSGLLAVAVGELELLGDDGSPTGSVLRSGEFVFPSEVLRAAPAPNTVRAGKGGALILVADRGVAQELLMTCPPLLELFAGM